MAKEHWTFEHPSDIGLEARADSLGELLEALAEGLANEVCSRDQVRSGQKRTLEVPVENRAAEVPDKQVAATPAPDHESLAVDFLTAIMNFIQVRHFMVWQAAVQLDESRVVVELSGEPYDPSRHEIKVEIKAVTYHQLRIGQEGPRWFGRVILDI